MNTPNQLRSRFRIRSAPTAAQSPAPRLERTRLIRTSSLQVARKLRFAIVLAAVIPALGACQPGIPELETRTFSLEHMDGPTAEILLMPYIYHDRESNPGMMTATERAVTVRETPDNLDRIARVLADLDQEPPEVLLRFQLIAANGPGEPDPRIADVEAELRALFRFEGYRLIGEAVVTPGSGRRFSTGILGSERDWSLTGGSLAQIVTTGPVPPVPPAPPGRGTIRLDDITLWSTPNHQALRTSVTIRPGQTLVVGSARAPEGQAGAIILTVRAEVRER
jgi:hypothetical protein